MNIPECSTRIGCCERISESLASHVDLDSQKKDVDRMDKMVPLTLGKGRGPLLVDFHCVHQIAEWLTIRIFETIQLRIHVIDHVGIELHLLVRKIQQSSLEIVQMLRPCLGGILLHGPEEILDSSSAIHQYQSWKDIVD